MATRHQVISKPKKKKKQDSATTKHRMQQLWKKATGGVRSSNSR